GPTRGRSAAPVRGPRRGERRAPRADLDRLRRAVARLPRAAPARARADGAAPPGRAARAGGEASRTACWAPGRCRGRTFGAGRPARLGPGERRQGFARAWTSSAGRDRGGARIPGGGRERADVATRVRGVARDRARA